MFSRATSLSIKTKQQKLDRLRPPSPWTNDLADEGVAVFVVQASRCTNMGEMNNNRINIQICLIKINNMFLLLQQFI
jgi:hypothetical protein